MAEIISISGNRREERKAAPAASGYAGRILALNFEKGRRFQCGGFFLGPRQPYGRVPDEAQTEPIRAALADGRLLDITEEFGRYKKGGSIIVNGSEIEQTRELEVTEKKIFFVRQQGEIRALIPENAEQGAELERMAERGKPLALPPGFDDPEKYLVRIEPYHTPVE